MSPRVLLAVGLFALSGCGFEPDLSRFDPCNEAGECRPGFICLTEAQRCVPECGESCPPPDDAGLDAGEDAGVDAGVDAGEDAGVDAGEDAGVDAGMEDAGTEDAGTEDAGTEDAGMEDAGVDGGEDAGPVLALAPVTLPAAIETQPWAYDFVPTGGVGAYTFLIDGGVPGFTLDVNGRFSTSAAPTPGTFSFSVTVRDSDTPTPAQVTTPFQLEVRPLLRVANSQLLDGRANQVYVDQLSALGGQPPYEWVVSSGMAPAGLMVLGDGGVRGAPTNAGNVTFGVTVTDSAVPPQQASRQVRVDTILLDLLVLSVATPTLRDARRGEPYAQPLKSYGGNQNGVTWSILPGANALPPGLTLTSATTNGLISGTPSLSADAGVYPFTLRCRDGVLGDISQMMSITVY